MMLLTDEEIIAAGYKSGDPDGLLQFGRNLEAAILAKLASAELPEPSILKDEELGDFSLVENHYTETSMRLIQSQAYAQGAAAQLAEKPSAWKLDGLGKATRVILYEPSDEHRQIYSCIYELYTRRQA